MRDPRISKRCLLPAVAALTLLMGACGPMNEAPPGDPQSTRTITTSASEETETGFETTRENKPSNRIEVQVVARNLEAPWGVAFLPGGDALVTERDTGRLLRVSDGGAIEEIQRIPEGGSGEGGLLGLALSPNYERDKLVYVYYSTGEDNRVGRFRLGEPPEPILTGIPVNVYHDGGGLAFGPDGMLYVTTGDAGNPETAQDKNSLSGKILRLTPDGGIPDDNPFPDNPTYSYGHRNVQGLAWDKSGQLYASEFGQDRFDEVNRIEPGGNYGWPEVEGEGGEPKYKDPIQTFAPDEASPSGAAILKNSAIPQWDGDFVMAALRGARLWRLELGPDGNVTGRESLLEGEYGRLRNAVQAPDGSLWVFTNNRDGRGTPSEGDDRILRLAPAG